jgi:hypothetical protein
MPSSDAGLVGIVREFLAAHELLRHLVGRYRSDALSFDELTELVGDGEESVLFRLKERSHALFRPGTGGSREVRVEEMLLDLAIGSLFHEAMKFRESFYQHAVYGPRVRSLRAQAGEESAELFQEFEKMLSVVSVRLEEGVQETEALLEQTGRQLLRLLAAHAQDRFLTRFLIERRDSVESVFGQGLDALLTAIHGDASLGYRRAAESYLRSGYYVEAEAALRQAQRRSSGAAQLAALSAYARGMAAYLSGEYAESVARLAEWVDAGALRDPALARLAHAAVSRIGQLVQGPERDGIVRAASALLVRIGSPAAPGPEAKAS